MKMLIHLDGSEFAEEVLGPASILAKQAQAEVILVGVVNQFLLVRPKKMGDTPR